MIPATPNSVVLTGCGWVTPAAVGTIDDVLVAAANSAAHESGRADGFLPVPDDPPPADLAHLSKELRRNKAAWMAALALEHACKTATLPLEVLDSDRVGLALGCALAGQLGMIDFAGEVRKQSVRFVSPIHFPETVGNYVAGALARSYKLRGPNVTLAGGPASSLDAIIEACAAVSRGDADIVLAGGVERLSAPLARGLGRTDTPLSEGACFFVVERANHAAARSTRPIATVVGWTQATDAASDGALVSSAGLRVAGAVFIEHAVGLCIGGAGAAATAAAIGAVSGAVVPRLQPSNTASIVLERVETKELRQSDGNISATILALRDSSTGEGCVRLDLSIAPGD